MLGGGGADGGTSLLCYNFIDSNVYLNKLVITLDGFC